MLKITVVGLGYIGIPTAITFAESGLDVYGFDINEKVIDTLTAGKLPIVEPGLQEAFEKARNNQKLTFEKQLTESDAFCITVPTPFTMENNIPKSDISYVESAAHMIGKVLKKGNLVILESTVPPCTTELVSKILSAESGLDESLFHTAHCPERIIPGNMLHELKNNDRIIGARTPEAAAIAKSIYEKILDKGSIHITDDITAEMCKLCENTFRDINIAYANELSVICHKLGINVFELIKLANCHPRVNILNPGVGVGGHCIAIDPWFLCDKFPEDAKVIEAARRRNDAKPFFVADLVEQNLGYDKTKTIAVLGLSYKADIDDFRESPSVILAHELQSRGYRVIACEPYSKESTLKGIANVPDLQECIDRCDYSVVTIAHSKFREGLQTIKQKPFFDCIGLAQNA